MKLGDWYSGVLVENVTRIGGKHGCVDVRRSRRCLDRLIEWTKQRFGLRGILEGLSDDWLDEIRRRIQESMVEAKRDYLRDEFGMQFEHTDSDMPVELENEWLDSVTAFEQQFAEAKTTTVRERLENPPIKPLKEMQLYEIGEALELLLELLAAYGIAVDFMGDVQELDAYRYITETLLDEEVDDVRIPGMVMHFEYSTPEYDVEMWVDDFVLDLFTQERDFFLSGLDKQPLFDVDGNALPAHVFQRQIEAVWVKFLPTNKYTLEPIVTKVDEDGGEVTAVISWHDQKRDVNQQVESFFRLHPSPYTGWDVVYTSLLEDMLQLVKGSST